MSKKISVFRNAEWMQVSPSNLFVGEIIDLDGDRFQVQSRPEWDGVACGWTAYLIPVKKKLLNYEGQ
jgi:hypothetical protein